MNERPSIADYGIFAADPGRDLRPALEGLISRLDNPRCRIRIVIGNVLPNCPQFILDAGCQAEFSHGLP